jgi:hypothetical protein
MIYAATEEGLEGTKLMRYNASKLNIFCQYLKVRSALYATPAKLGWVWLDNCILCSLYITYQVDFLITKLHHIKYKNYTDSIYGSQDWPRKSNYRNGKQ